MNKVISKHSVTIAFSEVSVKMTRVLLACGVVAGPVYLIVGLAQAFTRPGFDITHHDLSLLSNGDLGWIQVANLIITGLLVIASAVGMRQALYDGIGKTWALVQLAPSPIVELNRAVAVSMAFGPAAGLEIVDALNSEPSLKHYHLLPTVRADLLAKLGRFDEAGEEFKRVASLTRNTRERELLFERAAAVMKGKSI